MGLKAEIHEQPGVLRRLLETQRESAARIAEAIRAREVDYVFIAARGTSDNAGIYAKYLWGAFNRLPVALATPSLFTYYNQPPRLTRALVLGISQSGRSPDIVGVLEEGRRQGALTVAITNDTGAPLAGAAAHVMDITAGAEHAVAATKTYTASLMALAMLSCAMRDDNGDGFAALARVPAAIEEALRLDEAIARAAERYLYMAQCVVLGRGFNYATAFEWALKLKELTYTVAQPYSTADFRHGPIALVARGFPVMAVAARGPVYADTLALLDRLKEERRAELLIISDGEEALARGQVSLRLPGGLPEWVTPLVSIVPAQLFCYHLTCARGYDPDAPRGLSKVTETL
ncbi:MAG: SIS domain-containing protein [Anaerolineae bacterium]